MKKQSVKIRRPPMPYWDSPRGVCRWCGIETLRPDQTIILAWVAANIAMLSLLTILLLGTSICTFLNHWRFAEVFRLIWE